MPDSFLQRVIEQRDREDGIGADLSAARPNLDELARADDARLKLLDAALERAKCRNCGLVCSEGNKSGFCTRTPACNRAYRASLHRRPSFASPERPMMEKPALDSVSDEELRAAWEELGGKVTPMRARFSCNYYALTKRIAALGLKVAPRYEKKAQPGLPRTPAPQVDEIDVPVVNNRTGEIVPMPMGMPDVKALMAATIAKHRAIADKLQSALDALQEIAS